MIEVEQQVCIGTELSIDTGLGTVNTAKSREGYCQISSHLYNLMKCPRLGQLLVKECRPVAVCVVSFGVPLVIRVIKCEGYFFLKIKYYLTTLN